MSYIEIIFLIILIASLIMGFRKGLITQLGDIVGLIAAILVCRVFGAQAAQIGRMIMGSHVDDAIGHYMVGCIGYLVLFIIVWVGVKILFKLLKMTANVLLLGPVDRVTGALFMAAKCFIAVSVLLNIWICISKDTSIITGAGEHTASLVKFVVDLTPWLVGALAPVVTA